MAHIYKSRARKPLAVGPITNIGYGANTYPHLTERRYVWFNLGEAIIRIELTDAKQLRDDLDHVLKVAENIDAKQV